MKNFYIILPVSHVEDRSEAPYYTIDMEKYGGALAVSKVDPYDGFFDHKGFYWNEEWAVVLKRRD